MDHLIRQMGYVVMSTPDPDGSARDLAGIVGLKVTERSDTSVFMSANERRCEVVYRRGDTTGVVVIGLEAMDAASVDEVARRAPDRHVLHVALVERVRRRSVHKFLRKC